MANPNGISSLHNSAVPAFSGTQASAVKGADTSGIRSAAPSGRVTLNSIQNGIQNGIQTGVQNGVQTARTDKASLSSASGLISQVLGGNDVRLDKVAALQAAIAHKTYNVPASEVAGKMLDSLLG